MPADIVSLTPLQALGIPIALVGAVFLALGAQLQHRGVQGTAPAGPGGLRISALLALIRRPSWLIGTLMLGIAIVLQLVSLFLAPLTVVQPLVAIALIVTAILNARVTETPLTRKSIVAIICCVGGIGLFVTVAAVTTQTIPIGPPQLIIVLVILGVILGILLGVFALFRRRATAVFYIVAAGILFGFVATLAKVIIDRVHVIIDDGFALKPDDALTLVCLAGIIIAALLGTYFVQTAYASGPPDLVVAGLTVIDPLVGVSIGIIVLGEASTAPPWAGIVFAAAGALAIYGVIQLARRTEHANTTTRNTPAAS